MDLAKLKQNWKKIAIVLAAGLVLFSGGAVVGYYKAPTKTITKTVEVEKSTKDTNTNTQQNKNTSTDENKDIHRQITRKFVCPPAADPKAPPQLIEEQITEDILSKTTTDSQEQTKATEIKHEQTESTKTTIVTVTKEMPKNHLSFDLGINKELFMGQFTDLPMRLEYERRVVGPFYLGGWVDQRNSKDRMLGVSVGVDF